MRILEMLLSITEIVFVYSGFKFSVHLDLNFFVCSAPGYCRLLIHLFKKVGQSILEYSCLENPMNSMRRQKNMTLKDELLRSAGAQYATGEEWRSNSRKNEETEPKRKQCPVVAVTGDGSKVQCCKEQYCIGTWNVRSMNEGKLAVVKQEMARVDILGISELKWTGMGEFNSDDHYIYYCGQESLRRNGVALTVNKRV